MQAFIYQVFTQIYRQFQIKKKYNLWFISIFYIVISCKNSGIKDVSLKGKFYAKNLVSVHYNQPDDVQVKDISWYVAASPDGEWKKLQGIWTNEIILLTSYTGKYLKCEITSSAEDTNKKVTTSIVSSNPIQYRGNPNTDWLLEAGYGIMVHYLKANMAPDGGAKEWNRAVNSFNAKEFAQQVSETGAGFVMFTLGQNSGYYCSPNSVFNNALGTKPGELCSNRDLPKDLIHELNKHDIPLILYLPSNPPINNELVSEKFRYSFRKDSATSQYNQPILEDMIREWSMRYGKGVKGWWFDGLYSLNNIRSARMDMSRRYNISTHTLAAKAGNKRSIVTFNNGFGKIRANTPYCDYSAGEKTKINEFPSDRWIKDGVQWFLFTYLGERWGGKEQRFETEYLADKAEKIVEGGGVLSLEVVTDATGQIDLNHFNQVKAVGERLGKVKNK